MSDRGGEAVREKSNLLNRFNLIWVVQLSLQKYTSSLSSPNQCFFRAVPPRQEGRIAVVTNARRDAVDARASAHKMPQGELNLMSGKRCAGYGARCVRQNRVVLAPVAGVKLPVATSIQPDRLSHQAGSDGGKTNSSPGRARHKPSTHCAGNAGVPRLYLYARVRTRYQHCTRDRGCSKHPAFPAPSHLGDKSCKPRAPRVARPRDCIHRHCERSEAIHFAACGDMDCFVAIAPRNDGDSAACRIPRICGV